MVNRNACVWASASIYNLVMLVVASINFFAGSSTPSFWASAITAIMFLDASADNVPTLAMLFIMSCEAFTAFINSSPVTPDILATLTISLLI